MTSSALAWPEPPAPVGAGPELNAFVVADTVRACRDAFAEALAAVILTGSVARGEGTWAREEDGWSLLGDAEFLLLFGKGHRLPRTVEVEAVVARIQDRLRGRRLRCEITLAPCDDGYLRGLRPSIFAYELRACGRVVWGDADAIRAVPCFPAQAIPREDAWRLLSNRLVEQLEPLADAWPRSDELPPAVRYRANKLYLDMATSLLVCVGAYAPSYRQRSEALDGLARDARRTADLPLAVPELARKVAACTRFKLDPAAGAGDAVASWAEWSEAVLHARQLWRWETAILAGMPADAPDDALRARWMVAQPWPMRVRGWLYVARAEGWVRAWRLWPRWVRLARLGSPRHCVYAAATEVLFALAAGFDSTQAPADEKPPRRWLPVPGRDRDERDRFAALASDVVANYHRFLVGTRA